MPSKIPFVDLLAEHIGGNAMRQHAKVGLLGSVHFQSAASTQGRSGGAALIACAATRRQKVDALIL